ncbi:tetratricopeptide repeat protein [Fulvivirga sedimenti]|uniref:Tetratricopeptide repeat protein n=1 Tax=Fulvivirga sedimenti TaxID=2879465 RepID=A0A9X1L351_9BACT|nr:tetratricopeptide repeat protein [Fulvivirga sedimenti]MCA6078886.1 tetratricopeptide repeat protein [Fulvivirga sedimenti]
MPARIIQFPGQSPNKHGFRKARRKKRVNLEDFGQLNMFNTAREARIIAFDDEVKPFEKAMMLEEAGDIKEALRYYEKALKIAQHTADAYCNMGILSTELEKTREALNYFTLALADQPRHLEAHYNIANLYADLGNLDLARLHYEMAIQIEPSFASTYYNLALLFMDMGDMNAAEQRLMEFRSIADTEDKVRAGELLEEIRKLNIGNYE